MQSLAGDQSNCRYPILLGLLGSPKVGWKEKTLSGVRWVRWRWDGRRRRSDRYIVYETTKTASNWPRR
jgi:hypothetical protein